jgi:hypothetical protein
VARLRKYLEKTERFSDMVAGLKQGSLQPGDCWEALATYLGLERKNLEEGSAVMDQQEGRPKEAGKEE